MQLRVRELPDPKGRVQHPTRPDLLRRYHGRTEELVAAASEEREKGWASPESGARRENNEAMSGAGENL